MSRREDATLLRDMLLAAQQAMEAIRGRAEEDLVRDPIWALGIVKSLEIVGEAARKLSEGSRVQSPEIPWNEITGMRNRLVHAPTLTSITRRSGRPSPMTFHRLQRSSKDSYHEALSEFGIS
jgi:uncharacterized protein with HEPN domain